MAYNGPQMTAKDVLYGIVTFEIELLVTNDMEFK